MTAASRDGGRWNRLMNRYHAGRAGRGDAASGFRDSPEPRSIGRFSRGKHMSAGKFMVAGELAEPPNGSIWEISETDPDFVHDLHGFVWLDDLAAYGDYHARARAQGWVQEWLNRYGRGIGPGWAPQTTGRRVIRLVNNAVFLLRADDVDLSGPLYAALAQHVRYLSRRWSSAPPGLPRIEALTGLICAGFALVGYEDLVHPAVIALGAQCKASIDADGAIPSRSPEELLEVLTHLIWAAEAIREAGERPATEHLGAIMRIAPTLRALRHADGGLARFHGGGRGAEGRLDTALASSGIKGLPRHGLAMGYVRLAAVRTTVITDCAVPPSGVGSRHGHASTLAFELTSGRRPVIISCGDGTGFGQAWARAGRATASHSSLALAGQSSARLGEAGTRDAERLVTCPHSVKLQIGTEATQAGLVAGHDGYLTSHGLTHVRQLELSEDGRGLAGEDVLAAIEDDHKALFAATLQKRPAGDEGVPFDVRFHLHPDVEAQVDLGGKAVSLALKSGEIWIFRHDGVATMRLDPSVYLEKDRTRLRATKQIVLSHRAMRYATRVRWTLAKAQDTPTHLRDYERGDSDAIDSD